MYKLFDIELNRELVSSIAYILLSCGANIKNKYELDTILYKFYNFIKDDINFNDGVLITPELKMKIKEFSQIIDTLPNSPITDEYKFAFDIKGKDTSSDCVFEEDYVVVDVNDVHMANGVIINKGTAAFYPVFYLETNRISDNYKSSTRVTLKSFTEDFAYAKVGFKYYSASYVHVVVELYSEDGELITEYSKSVSLKPADYGIRIKYLYDNSTVTNIYSHYNHFIYDYSVDETTFDKLDVDLLEDGAIYKATDFIANTYRNQFINIHNIANKSIDGVNMDHPYQQLVKMLRREECYGDKLLFKYLTVFKQREGDTQYGIISTKPFYYTGDTTATSNDPALANISNTESKLNMYFRYFKSDDNGKTWVLQTGTVGSSTNSHTASGKYNTMDYRYPIYFNGYDVVYNNYPIFYGVKAIKFIREEDTDNFSDSKRLKVWRNSDEDFTLHDLPAGGVFYYGKYRVEDSFLSPLTFAVTSFADDLDRVCVLSTHKLEYMCYTTKTSSSSPREKGYSPQAELYQWLNSTRKGYSWWTSYYDGDLPPTEENCLANSYGYYAHKDGFLSNFTKAEMSIMEDRQLDFVQNVGSDKPDNIAKVHLPSVNELGCTSFPSHTLGRAKYMYTQAAGLHHNLKYHKKRFDESLFEGGDNIGGPVDSKYPVFVRHNSQGKIGVATGNTTSTSYVERNNVYCVQPFMVLQDAKISREPDENGIFSLNFEQEPPQDVAIHSDIERNIIEESSVSYDVDRNVVKTVVKEFDVSRVMKFNVFGSANILRNVTHDFSRTHQIIRHLHNKTIREYDIERNKTVTIIRRANIERQVIGFMTRKHNVFRNVLEDFRKNYDVERNVRHCFDVANEYDIERNVLINHITLHDILRDINIDYLLSSDIIRDVYQAEVFYGNVVRDVLGYCDKEFSVERNIRTIDDIVKDIDVLREIIHYVRTPYDIIRNIRMNIANEFDVIRAKVRDNAKDFDVQRTIVVSKDADYDVERLVNKDHIFEADVIRDKIESVENIHDILREVLETITSEGDIERSIVRTLRRDHNVVRLIQGKTESGYDICRDIVKDSAISNDIERVVVEDVNIEHDVMRQLLISVANEFDAIRDALEDFACESDIERALKQDIAEEYQAIRDVLSNIENEFDVERTVTLKHIVDKYFDVEREINADFTYVSRENLDYYTLKLKEKIDQYINKKVEMLLEEKLRERFK